MSNSSSLIVVVAFAGVLIWFGAAPARAAGADDACRMFAPRYEPKAARPSGVQPVRWPGGAKLWRPVAEPCAQSRPAVNA